MKDPVALVHISRNGAVDVKVSRRKEREEVSQALMEWRRADDKLRVSRNARNVREPEIVLTRSMRRNPLKGKGLDRSNQVSSRRKVKEEGSTAISSGDENGPEIPFSGGSSTSSPLKLVVARARRRSDIEVGETRAFAVDSNLSLQTRKERDLIRQMERVLAEEEHRRNLENMARALQALARNTRSQKQQRAKNQLARLWLRRSRLRLAVKRFQEKVVANRAARHHSSSILRKSFLRWVQRCAETRERQILEITWRGFRRLSLLKSAFSTWQRRVYLSKGFNFLRDKVTSRQRQHSLFESWKGWRIYIRRRHRKAAVNSRSTLFWARRRMKLCFRRLRILSSGRRVGRVWTTRARQIFDENLMRRTLRAWRKATVVCKAEKKLNDLAQRRFERLLLRRYFEEFVRISLSRRRKAQNIVAALLFWESHALRKYLKNWKVGLSLIQRRQAGEQYFERRGKRRTLERLRSYAKFRLGLKVFEAAGYHDFAMVRRHYLGWVNYCNMMQKTRSDAIGSSRNKKRLRDLSTFFHAWAYWTEEKRLAQNLILFGYSFWETRLRRVGFQALKDFSVSKLKRSEREREHHVKINRSRKIVALRQLLADSLSSKRKRIGLAHFQHRLLKIGVSTLRNNVKIRRQLASAESLRSNGDRRLLRISLEAFVANFRSHVERRKAIRLYGSQLLQRCVTKWRSEAYSSSITRYGAFYWGRKWLRVGLEKLSTNRDKSLKLKAQEEEARKRINLISASRTLTALKRESNFSIAVRSKLSTQQNQNLRKAVRSFRSKTSIAKSNRSLLHLGLRLYRKKSLAESFKKLCQNRLSRISQGAMIRRAAEFVRHKHLRSALLRLRLWVERQQMSLQAFEEIQGRREERELQLCFMAWAHLFWSGKRERKLLARQEKRRRKIKLRQTLVHFREFAKARRQCWLAIEYWRKKLLLRVLREWRKSKRIDALWSSFARLRLENAFKWWRQLTYKAKIARFGLGHLIDAFQLSRIRASFSQWKEHVALSDLVEVKDVLRSHTLLGRCMEHWGSFVILQRVKRANKLLAAFFWRNSMTSRYWWMWRCGVREAKYERAAEDFARGQILGRAFSQWQEYAIRSTLARAHDILASFHWRSKTLRRIFWHWNSLILQSQESNDVFNNGGPSAFAEPSINVEVVG